VLTKKIEIDTIEGRFFGRKINFEVMKMKKIMLQILISFALLIFIFSFLGVAGIQSSQEKQEEKPKHQIEKARIYREDYPLISESDLYCSIFILEDKKLDVKIIDAEKAEEKKLFSDADIVFLDKGRNRGLEVDKMFLILEVGENIQGLGPLGLKRGRARIIDVGEDWGHAQIEKTCGRIMIGHFMIPFEEKKDLLERVPIIDISHREGRILQGNIVYQDLEIQIGSRNVWGLIDLGKEDGLLVGERMNIYKESSKKAPPKLIGDLVVVDTQRSTSTVKILSSTDAVRPGDIVQTLTEESYK